MVLPGFRKLQWIRRAADHQTVTMTFFYASLALGSALELLLSPITELVITSCIKIHALGFNKLLESIFCLLLVVEAFSLQKAVEMLEETVVSW